jgi:hypothetical protein
MLALDEPRDDMHTLHMTYRPKKVYRFAMVMSESERKDLRLLCEKTDSNASDVMRALLKQAAKRAELFKVSRDV